MLTIVLLYRITNIEESVSLWFYSLKDTRGSFKIVLELLQVSIYLYFCLLKIIWLANRWCCEFNAGEDCMLEITNPRSLLSFKVAHLWLIHSFNFQRIIKSSSCVRTVIVSLTHTRSKTVKSSMYFFTEQYYFILCCTFFHSSMTHDCNNLLFSSILCWWWCHQDFPEQVHSVGQFPGLTGRRWPKSSAWDRILTVVWGWKLSTSARSTATFCGHCRQCRETVKPEFSVPLRSA